MVACERKKKIEGDKPMQRRTKKRKESYLGSLCALDSAHAEIPCCANAITW
jgi:hypothetical protein